MRPTALRGGLAAVLWLLSATATAGQRLHSPDGSGGWTELSYAVPALPGGSVAAAPTVGQSAESAGSIVRPAALSLLVPGLGQHTLGQRRRWIYWTLEAVGWAAYLNRRSAGSSARDAYRDFAWNQARLQSGARIDGSFSYYETMSQWSRSGSFDTDPSTAGTQPEMDPATFNGAVWGLATGLFFPPGPPPAPTDPAYQSAVSYYEDRAYDDAFLWDWTGTSGGQATFGELIDESDRGFRQATNVLGGILAHHVVSAVDAFASARAGTSISGSVDPDPRGLPGSWQARVTVPVGR